MQWYTNLKIAKKLIIGFVIVAIIAGIVGLVGIVDLQNIEKLDTELYERHTATLPELANIATNYERHRVSVRNLYLEKNSEDRQIALDEIHKELELMETNINNFELHMNEAAVKESFDSLKRNLKEYLQLSDELVKLIVANKNEEAYVLLTGNRIAEIGNKIQADTDKLMTLKTNLAKQSSDKNTTTANTAILIMIIVVGIGILTAIILGMVISRIISKPINNMVHVAERLALGEVNVNVTADTKDEIGMLAKAFNKMIENIRAQALVAEKIAEGDFTVQVDIRSDKDILGIMLKKMVDTNNEVIGNIATAAEQVAVGSRQISESSISLSQGATEQASSVEELTASLEEISSQTKLNAQNAEKANGLSEMAKNNAVQGNMQMKDMLKSMDEINQSSANIYKIIKVIDDIAFQTNILALNAAVEAARAGQHGKGFAVVAEEVRNLAARSADAAKETTAMIEESIKKSDRGTIIAKETAEALNKIVDGIEEVASIVNNISHASVDQATGIQQINQGIIQVSEVVQTNSATSEEGAAASEELSSQAALLKEMVSKFKLRNNFKAYRSIDEISPELLVMLENMTQKNKSKSSTVGNIEDNANKSKISLSDQDFGKY